MTRKLFPDARSLAALWRASPSEQEGYQRCYQTETADGDRLQVDFNFSRRMARIELSLQAERNRTYIAVVKSGVVLQERELSARRSLDLTSRLLPMARYFEHLPDAMLLQSLGGAYGLPATLSAASLSARRWNERYPLQRRFRLWRWMRERIERRRQVWLQLTPWQRLLRRFPEELLDLSAAAACGIGYMSGYLSLTELAGAWGALALFSGGVDWTLRQRDPFLPKVLALLMASAWAVYLQVQYRMWAIFL
ncbi:MAG: hypothetical protein K1X75_03870 [Leptospirales bacterium]|nr:hypothetical protein [Leptospirales bacterium]